MCLMAADQSCRLLQQVSVLYKLQFRCSKCRLLCLGASCWPQVRVRLGLQRYVCARI